MNLDEGPMQMAAKITGVQPGGLEQDSAPYFTNNEGIPWPDPAHSKNVGGLPLISDPFLMQKQQTFNRSKTLERMVHPSGSGAFGYFECTQNMSMFTKAGLFNEENKRTPIFLRFSTVTFGREFPDSGRNPRGFAIKHYTEEGNYDVVGLNWPIFFCRDPIQGPDVIRSQQRNPKNFLLDYNSMFDFLANVPESNHAGLMLFSDNGTPRGWRSIHGYGCHTFRWVNDAGQFVYVKYHYCNEAGRHDFTWPEAVQMSGEDPDFAKRDLWSAIERGDTPTWTMKVQIMSPEDANPDKLGFDPFDVTKVWPKDQYPCHEVGRIVLNKNPDDYHRDVEQAAFSPGAMVPGIEDSPDPLLQFRMFFYRDAQYHRFGSTNIHQIPVNCPFMARSFSTPNYAGSMRSDGNTGSNPHYAPNSFTDKYERSYAETPYTISDNIVSRKSHFWSEGKPDREYEQARQLYLRVMGESERCAVHNNTASALKLVGYPKIIEKYLGQLFAIDESYARGVWDQLPERGRVSWDSVKGISKNAAIEGKDKKLRPSTKEDKLVGVTPEAAVYQN
ncbi:catalase [Macrolepiota fuliginosa MF-IS2]|uniref:Catalase n=1 Tax=Macrolepiota fuliginosa MF-IS2 TaxID=1400762 RepID=A0A9P5XCV4_9AGAR|nr:catalase [Macrolepiota fuliginosa MF-IS2]